MEKQRETDGWCFLCVGCCSKTMGRCSLVRWFGRSSVSGFDIQLMEAIKIISYPNSHPLLTVTESNQNTALKELTRFPPERNWWERSRHTLNPAFLLPCSASPYSPLNRYATRREMELTNTYYNMQTSAPACCVCWMNHVHVSADDNEAHLCLERHKKHANFTRFLKSFKLKQQQRKICRSAL